MKALSLLAVLALSVFSMSATAAQILQSYSDPDGSGNVFFTDEEDPQTFTIVFQNTTNVDYGSLITGLAFNVEQDITSASVESFWGLDENNDPVTDLTSYWSLGLDTQSSGLGSTVFDITFDTDNGSNGGIYNADTNYAVSANQFPDLAVLRLSIVSPDPWELISVSNDILRMQQAGFNGENSLKLSGTPIEPRDPRSGPLPPPNGVPIPGTMALMAFGLAAVPMFSTRRRRAR